MRQQGIKEPVNKTKIRLLPVVAAMFLLSFSVLSFEIALTRIFSILVSYHYVFSIVSMVPFGLGIGAMLVPCWHRWFPNTSYPLKAILFSLLIVLSLAGIIALPLVGGNLSFNLRFWLLTVLAAVPFLAAGLVMAELYQEFAPRGSLLYGFDLLGSQLFPHRYSTEVE
jgi:hypothetical protein